MDNPTIATEAQEAPAAGEAAPATDRVAAAIALVEAKGRAPAEAAPGVVRVAPKPAVPAKPVEPVEDIEQLIRQRAVERTAKATEGQAQQTIASLQSQVAELQAKLGQPSKPDAKALTSAPLAALRAMGYEFESRALLQAAYQEVLNPSAVQVRAELEKRLAEVPVQKGDPAEIARTVYAEERARAENEQAFHQLANPEAFPLASRLKPAKLLEKAYALIEEFGPDAFAAPTDEEANRSILKLIEKRQHQALADELGADALAQLLGPSPARPKTAESGTTRVTPKRGTTITSELQAAGSHRRAASPKEREAAAVRLAQQQMDRR